MSLYDFLKVSQSACTVLTLCQLLKLQQIYNTFQDINKCSMIIIQISLIIKIVIMGSQNTIPQCTKVCESVMDIPSRDKFRQQVAQKQKTKQRPRKTQMYRSKIVYEQSIQTRQSKAFDLVSLFSSQAYKQSLPPINFASGAIYTGQWIQSQMNGTGTLRLKDGSLIQGSFMNNKVNGKAKMTFKDKDVYQGQWKDNMACGFGVYNHNSGATYQGYWLNNLQHGVGIQQWTDTSRYQGSYIKGNSNIYTGKKQGEGKYIWPDQSYYKGQWFQNKIQGTGQYVWSNGRNYQGDWKHNQMHGYGVHQWEDGRRYQGNYQYDKKEGLGKYFWPDGKRFQGTWTDGKRQGLGKIINQSGDQKIGLWENDKKVKWMTNQQIEEFHNMNNRGRRITKTSTNSTIAKKNIQKLNINLIQKTHEQEARRSLGRKQSPNRIIQNQNMAKSIYSQKRLRKIFKD